MVSRVLSESDARGVDDEGLAQLYVEVGSLARVFPELLDLADDRRPLPPRFFGRIELNLRSLS